MERLAVRSATATVQADANSMYEAVIAEAAYQKEIVEIVISVSKASLCTARESLKPFNALPKKSREENLTHYVDICANPFLFSA